MNFFFFTLYRRSQCVLERLYCGLREVPLNIVLLLGCVLGGKSRAWFY